MSVNLLEIKVRTKFKEPNFYFSNLKTKNASELDEGKEKKELLLLYINITQGDIECGGIYSLF